MKLFDIFKRKDKKTLDVKQYDNNSEVVKKAQHHSITIDPTSAIKPEEYYDRKSHVFGNAKIVVTVMLVGLIIMIFTVFSDVFSSENFKYLIKHINLDPDKEINEFRDVVYPDTLNSSFGDFRQDFVIAAPGVLKIYNYNGGVSLNSTPSTNNPKLSISKECILLYDEGDKDFYIYNNFSKLYSSTLEDKIIMADASDSGRFVIVTQSAAHAAKVYVYNEDYTVIRGINRNTPVTGARISPNGRYLALTTVEINGASCISTLTVYDLGKEPKSVITQNIYNEIPAGMEFENDDEENLSLCIITDKAVRRYTMAGEQESVVLQGENPQIFHINENNTAYTVKNDVISNRTTLYCISNKDMTLLLEKDFDEKIMDIRISGENIYVLTKTKLIMLNFNNEEKIIELSEKPLGMVVFSGTEVFIRYSGVFKLAVFEG